MLALFFFKFNGTKWSEIFKKGRKTKQKAEGKKNGKFISARGCYAMHNKIK